MRVIYPLKSEVGVYSDLRSAFWEGDKFAWILQEILCDVILTYWYPSMIFFELFKGRKLQLFDQTTT